MKKDSVPHGVHVIGSSIILSIMAAFIATQLIPYQGKEESQTSSVVVQKDNSVVGELLKEMRLSLADLMWLKTEEYIHDGIQHRRAEKDGHEHEGGDECDCEGEHNEDHGDDFEYEEHGHGFKHHHGGTLIPKKEDDFRGILGDIQRQTQPFSRQHRIGRDLAELLPWLRLTTLANPHHIAAHRATAFFLANYLKRPAVAIETIQDALKLNPDNPQLLVVLGRLHFYDRKDPRKALEVFKKVVELWHKSDKDWSEDDRFAVAQAYLHIGYCLEWQGKLSEAMEWIGKGTKEFPDYEPLSKFVQGVNKRRSKRERKSENLDQRTTSRQP